MTTLKYLGAAVIGALCVMLYDAVKPSRVPVNESVTLPITSNFNNNNNIATNRKNEGGETCRWVFEKYSGSEWEEKWVKGIEKWQGQDGPYNDTDWWKAPGAGCEEMVRDVNKVDQFEVEREANVKDGRSVLSKEIFSYFTYRNSCRSDEVKEVGVEPLVSFLRHPRAVCFDDINSPRLRMRKCRRKKQCLLLSKDYLVFPHSDGLRTGKSYFFDIGASFYDTGFGGASQKWFVEHFSRLGWDFDRILAWEAIVNKEPSSYWNRVPKEVKHKITYYNIPVQSPPDHPDNPWYYVKQLCRPQDYCMMKLDIDTPKVEEALINQLLTDTTLHPLVDDLVWEHHVRRNPLTYPGGWELENAQDTQSTVATSYSIFLKFRQLGIRAHSWV